MARLIQTELTEEEFDLIMKRRVKETNDILVANYIEEIKKYFELIKESGYSISIAGYLKDRKINIFQNKGEEHVSVSFIDE